MNHQFAKSQLMQETYYDPKDLRKFGKISEWNQELGDKFFEYYNKVFEAGTLSPREKSLIALAVAHTIQCPYCIDAYTGDGFAAWYHKRGDDRGFTRCWCYSRRRNHGPWCPNDE